MYRNSLNSNFQKRFHCRNCVLCYSCRCSFKKYTKMSSHQKRKTEDELRKYVLKNIMAKRFRSLELCFDIFLECFPNRIAKEDEVVKMLAWTLLHYRRFEPCDDNLKSWLQTSIILWQREKETFRVLVDCPNESSYLLFCMQNISTGHRTEISIEKEHLKSADFKASQEAQYKIDCVICEHAKANVLCNSPEVEKGDSELMAKNRSNEAIDILI